MKKITFLVLFFISAGNCFAQQVTFQKKYSNITAVGNEGHTVQQTADTGYIMAGIINFGGADHNVQLIKTNAYGDTLWTKYYTDVNPTRYPHSVKQTADGGYIVGGAIGGGFGLIKTDSTGNPQWQKSYIGPNSNFCWFEQTADGGYIGAGEISNFGTSGSEIYVVKTNSTGDTLWTKTYGTALHDWAKAVKQTSDGGYIITGCTRYLGGGLEDIYLVKIDSAGNHQWSKSYGGAFSDEGFCVQQTNDGGYIIGGYFSPGGFFDFCAIKTNPTGDTLWTKTYDVNFGDNITSIEQTNDGGYIFAGTVYYNLTGDLDICLLKTSVNGNLTWSAMYGDVSQEEAFSVHQTFDGGYVMGGYTYNFGSPGFGFYLIKTDSIGNSGCNLPAPVTTATASAIQIFTPPTVISHLPTTVSGTIYTANSGSSAFTICTNVGINTISNSEFPISISPNPTTNDFTITFPNTINKGIIEIYNVLGEKIFKGDIFNVSQKEIHLNNINAGIYFVKVKDGEREYCKKLVIE